jgi:RNA polymerase II subunit A small phosphatase-like protein
MYNNPGSKSRKSDQGRFSPLMDKPCAQHLAELSPPALVLDLDETLTVSFQLPIKPGCIPIRAGRKQRFVLPRPGLNEFMQRVSSLYDIYFFTSSLPQYANAIIDAIAPETPTERRLFWQHCVSTAGYPVKDLRLLGRPLHRVVR